MKKKIAGLAALSTLFVVPAQAEIGRGPGPGKAYISVEGGYKNSDGAAVSSHGDLRTNSPTDPNTAGASGVLVQPGFVGTVTQTEVRVAPGEPPAGQIVEATSEGALPPGATTCVGGVCIFNEATTTINPALGTDSITSTALGRADAIGFLDAFASVLSSPSGAAASANAQGGSFIETEQSGYAGLTFGYGFTQPLFNAFDRIEVYGSISRADESQHVDGAAGAISVDGTSAFAAAVVLPNGFTPGVSEFGPITTDVRQSVDFAEFGARLKADRWNYNSAMLTMGLEGFYAVYNQDTRMDAFVGGDVGVALGNNFFRSAEIDSDMVGLLVSLEGQLPIGGTPLSLIGRTFGGLYYLSADGKFRDDFGVADVNDSLSDWGYRLGVEGGLRYDLSPSASVALTGAIDHFSDVATADLPRFSGDVAHVDTDELTSYKVGARLTVTLGDDPAPFK